MYYKKKHSTASACEYERIVYAYSTHSCMCTSINLYCYEMREIFTLTSEFHLSAVINCLIRVSKVLRLSDLMLGFSFSHRFNSIQIDSTTFGYFDNSLRSGKKVKAENILN